jgi:hypothetical protein
MVFLFVRVSGAAKVIDHMPCSWHSDESRNGA